MSKAAGALIRALVARAGVAQNRILLTDVQSTDWQSLTFAGERHRLDLRVTGADADEITQRICAQLESFEFTIPGVVVADIALVERRTGTGNSGTELVIEALTIAAD
jgi:hypothetical protein